MIINAEILDIKISLHRERTRAFPRERVEVVLLVLFARADLNPPN